MPLGLVQTAHWPQSSLRLHASQRPQAFRRDFLAFAWSGESTGEPACLSSELGGTGVASPLLSAEPNGEGASRESSAFIGLNGSAGRAVLVGEFCHAGKETDSMGRKLGKTLADMTSIAAATAARAFPVSFSASGRIGARRQSASVDGDCFVNGRGGSGPLLGQSYNQRDKTGKPSLKHDRRLLWSVRSQASVNVVYASFIPLTT